MDTALREAWRDTAVLAMALWKPVTVWKALAVLTMAPATSTKRAPARMIVVFVFPARTRQEVDKLMKQTQMPRNDGEE